jgi:hypothetical protein
MRRAVTFPEFQGLAPGVFKEIIEAEMKKREARTVDSGYGLLKRKKGVCDVLPYNKISTIIKQ